jgi:1-acyl-sn-glycerol-3-phosphate acyltransferase
MRKYHNKKINPLINSLFGLTVMEPTLFFLYDVRVEGLEHLPRKGPAALACKHWSWMDAFVLATRIPRTINYLAKQELFENLFGDYPGTFLYRVGKLLKPVTSRGLESLGCLRLDRDRPERYVSTFKILMRLITMDEYVGYFPEGKVVPGEMGEFKPGLTDLLVRMQKRTGIKIPFIPLGFNYREEKGEKTVITLRIGEGVFFEPGDCSAILALREKIRELSML